MTTVFQTPQPPPPLRPVPLHKATLPQTVFVDRDGDEWSPAGHNASGELILACPSPSSPGDQGEGPSHAWTLSKVRGLFGPLMARSAVAR